MSFCKSEASYLDDDDDDNGDDDHDGGDGDDNDKGPFIYYVIADRGGGVSPIYYNIR